MKLYYLLLVALLSCTFTVSAQEEEKEPKGKISGRVYFNYHIDGTENAEQTSVFEVTRAYFGYQYKINEKFTSKILFDAGKNEGGSDYTIFIKNAKLDYKAEDWLKFTAGIFGLKQFKEQETFWGYRYLFKSLEDEYKFGPSADVGVMAEIKINDELKVDVMAVNGEGFRNLQDRSGNNRYGINLVYQPVSNLILKAYYDTMNGIDIEDETQNTTVSNIALFAGYTIKDRFRIAAEYSLMKDGVEFNKPSKNKDLHGLSFYSAYNINEKWSVFGRYDDLSSNRLPGDTMDWNFAEDESTIIAGFEFKPTIGVNTSVNYRFTDFDDPENINESLVFFNLEFYF
jgi:hypothetical protein